MQLNIREIVAVPGSSASFSCTLDFSRLAGGAIEEVVGPAAVSGRVYNSAGVLYLEGSVQAKLLITCDRCAGSFEREKTVLFDVRLCPTGELEEDPNVYPHDGEFVNLGEIAETVFYLNLESKFLCSEACKGLCPECGRNLNTGTCNCGKKVDPRFAALEQYLKDMD